MTGAGYIFAGVLGSAPVTGWISYILQKRRTGVELDALKKRGEIEIDAARQKAKLEQSGREEEISNRTRQAALEALKIPLELLKDELAKREAELSDMRKQDREDNHRTITALNSITAAMNEMAADVRAKREEDRHHAEAVRKELEILDRRLYNIETRMGISKAE
jgi:hypothetical protein